MVTVEPGKAISLWIFPAFIRVEKLLVSVLHLEQFQCRPPACVQASEPYSYLVLQNPA